MAQVLFLGHGRAHLAQVPAFDNRQHALAVFTAYQAGQQAARRRACGDLVVARTYLAVLAREAEPPVQQVWVHLDTHGLCGLGHRTRRRARLNLQLQRLRAVAQHQGLVQPNVARTRCGQHQYNNQYE